MQYSLALLLLLTTTLGPSSAHASPDVDQRRRRDASDGGITVPLTRRAPKGHRPFKAGRLSKAELASITYVTDVGALQAARDALIDKYTFDPSQKRALVEKRRLRDLEQNGDSARWKEEKKKKRETDVVALTNHNFDTVYSANVALGTPAKSFRVLLDTGSSDTWVTAANCSCTTQGCNACVSGSSWDPTGSSTYAQRGKLLKISYGSGVVQGFTGNDVLSLGGFSVQDQVVGIVDTAARVLPGDVEGLMGLAFGRIAQANGTPWWLRIIVGEGGKTLDNPVMSFWLSRYVGTNDTTQNDHPGGQFVVGGTNSSLYTGDIAYYDVVQPAKWWLINVAAVGIEGGNSVTVDQHASQAIIDTGTTLVGGQDTVVDSILSTVEGSVKGETLAAKLRGFYALPCDTTATVTLSFGSETYSMTARDLLYMRIDDVRANYCLASLFVFSSNDRHSINFRDPDTPYWLVGDAFLKNVYSVFDLGSSSGDGTPAGLQGMGNTGTTARVGFAKLSGTSGEIGLAAQPSGVASASNSISGAAASTSSSNFTNTALPIGVIPDVVTTVVVVTASEDPASPSGTRSSTSGASSTSVSALLGGVGMVVGIAIGALL